MKLMQAFVGLAVMAGTATGVLAGPDPVVVGDYVTFGDGPGNTGGGEFGIHRRMTSGSGAGYVDSWSYLGAAFVTFCLEATETVTVYSYTHVGSRASYYVYDISQTAYNGSVGPVGDQLCHQTAWLYYMFRTDQAGLGYTGSQTDANNLQKAIWYWEGEAGGVNNAYASAANNAVVNNNWQNNNRVGVMNIRATSNPNSTRHQSQLVLIPLPGAGGMATAGVGGLLLVGGIRRRR